MYANADSKQRRTKSIQSLNDRRNNVSSLLEHIIAILKIMCGRTEVSDSESSASESSSLLGS